MAAFLRHQPDDRRNRAAAPCTRERVYFWRSACTRPRGGSVFLIPRLRIVDLGTAPPIFARVVDERQRAFSPSALKASPNTSSILEAMEPEPLRRMRERPCTAVDVRGEELGALAGSDGAQVEISAEALAAVETTGERSSASVFRHIHVQPPCRVPFSIIRQLFP